MRSIVALLRAAWFSAASYRVAMVISMAGIIASVVPVYFMAKAVAPLAQESIRLEGANYFGFVVIGIAASYVLMSATGAIPTALSSSIGSGTFEALLVTRTPLPVLLAGLAAYPIAQSFVNATAVVLGGVAFGVRVDWRAIPFVLLILFLLVLAHAAVGLVAAALTLVFRTSGPLITAVVSGSNLLGGVFYSTSVIPGWLQSLSGLFPLTYALRAIRRLLLSSAPVTDVAPDVGMLALLAITGLAIGSLAFGAALRHARRAGTLTHL